MNKDLTSLIHSSGNPLDNILEVFADILVWRVFNIKHFVLEILGVHWIHSSHSLNNMGDTSVLQVMDAFCCLNTPNIQLGDNLRHVRHVCILIN